MNVRYQGDVAIVTPVDQRSLDNPEALENELWLQHQAGRSVVIDAGNLRDFDNLTVGMLTAARARFERAGLHLTVVLADKHIQAQIHGVVSTDLTVEMAIAAIERSTQAPAASR